ncbi:metallo-beta-lactamase superfamily protein [Synechococcus sp. PCC 7335]|uniref:MBL fold metallo-hydrolase n=1 Tax=Synechococcus sp. (strain ATCC 29403 / PCC 7335) TaxID=91464 RepID=UPI00017ED9DD|nr:MBL fold metallo-hydrolase [Synechococcus sp. PCC 7335]EDX83058.1 metallo-beta-lactamase superfamily protein [Synechococcus sp. PCC 7335]
MLFRQLFDDESSTYTYLIADPQTQEAVLVDPVVENVDRDLKLIRELDLTLLFCLETHIHADHITGTGKIRDRTGCKGLVPENAHTDCASEFVKHGQILKVGSVTIEAIETHGHTDSHMAYLVEGDRVLTGDALLIRGCGRTDFQGGSAKTLYDHITQRLFTLPDSTRVYPAHDYHGQTVSTIGEEKRWNPRFVETDADPSHLRERADFVQLMNNLDLPDPKKIMEAVPANEHCGKKAA